MTREVRLDGGMSIKANQRELDAWEKAARRAGVPRNTWVRMVLDHAAGVSSLYRQLESVPRERYGKK